MHLGLAPFDHEQSNKTGLSQVADTRSDISKRLVGTWRLVTTEGRPGGAKREHNPSGYIIYDSTGHVNVQIMLRNDRARFVSEDLAKATIQEKALAFDSYLSYYGTYTVNEAKGIITHHVEGSLDPNDIGKDLVRYFEFSEDRITLIPTRLVENNLVPKSEVKRRLTWEKVGLSRVLD
jgi:hypothetical protein